ncbi:MAG: dipeptide epimerase [Balneolaceae bacterium]|jgi:L-alanine-DL-glutamate epimerase-like enolase superfamily enzyme
MSHFDLEYRVLELKLDQPFTISRGTKNSVRNVFVTLTSEGVTGYGEAGPNLRYDEDAGKVGQFIDRLGSDFFDEPGMPEEIAAQIAAETPAVHAAAAAVEMAWLDWWGKMQEQPLWKLWNAPSHQTPPTSYTIGLDSIDIMQQKVKAAADYPILKVKLGTGRDQAIIGAIREVTDKPIRVDANEGWTNIETAKKHISFLAENNIELVEQPMPSAMHDEMTRLKQWSPLPLMADESFIGDENLGQIAEAFDGINIKLMKTGSLVKAREVIRKARQLNLQVMVGCMIESSLAISAGALVGTWADYVDLDGFLLIRDDPYEGLGLTAYKEIVLGNGNGLGVSMTPSPIE